MKIGPRPNQLACTPDGKIVYVPCDDATWWVIDAVNAKVIQKIATALENRSIQPEGVITTIAATELIRQLPVRNELRNPEHKPDQGDLPDGI